MINHIDMQKQLSAYCGGDLDPAERLRLEEHLAGCASCRAELADLQTALRLIRTTPEEEPPAWLATRIMARVREEPQQKRSWLQRIFFPLHVKLPLEAAALLMVCVTGYYLARSVETELHQPASLQERPAPSGDTGTPLPVPRKESPAPLPATPAVPRPAGKPPLPPKADIPARPSAPAGADQFTPQPAPAPPRKAPPEPAFAPPPPAMKVERIAPAGEAPYDHRQSFQPVPGGRAAQKAKKGEAPLEMDSGRSGYHRAMPESVRGASDRATGAAGPTMRIRLVMSDPASAPGSLREAVTSSGGSVMDDRPVRPHTLKARIPSLRMNELLALLARLGTVVERPPAKEVAGMVEIELSW